MKPYEDNTEAKGFNLDYETPTKFFLTDQESFQGDLEAEIAGRHQE